MKEILIYDGLVAASLGLLQERHAPIFAPWINRRVGVEGTLQQPPYSPESGREWVRSLDKSKGKDEVFAVLERTKTKKYRYVGHVGIHRITWPDGFATTGSILGPQNQARNLGTEAKILLLYHAFMILGLRKLTSTVKSWNAPSLGHLIKCGYKIVGRHKEHHLHEGAYGDEILLEVFRKDWEPVWEQYQKTKTVPSLTPEQRALVTKETST